MFYTHLLCQCMKYTHEKNIVHYSSVYGIFMISMYYITYYHWFQTTKKYQSSANTLKMEIDIDNCWNPCQT